MTLEEWKDIPGHEGKYQVSNLGRVRSLDRYVRGETKNGTEFKRLARGKILTPGVFTKCGHLSLPLGRRTHGRPVHQLVLLAFEGPCPEGMEVRHLNGDPQDNRLANLEYGTRTENILDVYRQGKRWRKLSTEDVQEIRRRLASEEAVKSIAASFEVSIVTIYNIKKGVFYGWLKPSQ
ncbi:HNH endonuclease [Sporosarcina trichiuri]|uniref:HNH endonuclease n=1 Tax=Sporosarcina trichiuri TaxID=3056445 RepID=UPI0025B4A13E|nr:HNH endonuclease [Sporosarcina sp. 0.2-SM1T-5]WJY27425.1 HNH endonuclease [Sporosarcina sp. 0.2-SM1T-5]WJY27445.1 HNH endonuclease [Sporosarcina sp. 0.2-SM1T-5]